MKEAQLGTGREREKEALLTTYLVLCAGEYSFFFLTFQTQWGLGDIIWI